MPPRWLFIVPSSRAALSPYLKFGAVSCRSFYWGIVDAYSKETKCTNPPVSLQGQLLWREFFYAHSYAEPKFDRMEGNKLCKQVGSLYSLPLSLPLVL
jgi:cryptochrome